MMITLKLFIVFWFDKTQGQTDVLCVGLCVKNFLLKVGLWLRIGMKVMSGIYGCLAVGLSRGLGLVKASQTPDYREDVICDSKPKKCLWCLSCQCGVLYLLKTHSDTSASFNMNIFIHVSDDWPEHQIIIFYKSWNVACWLPKLNNHPGHSQP